MKKDIDFAPVQDVYLTVVRESDEEWRVHIINRSINRLENVMITSKGYGEKKKEKQQTSILRHAIPYLDPGAVALIEPIHPDVFHLTNEYWVSFYIANQIFDKKYLFVPDSIKDENLIYIEELDQKGVLHS
jgi:hypothetical protein